MNRVKYNWEINKDSNPISLIAHRFMFVTINLGPSNFQQPEMLIRVKVDF